MKAIYISLILVSTIFVGCTSTSQKTAELSMPGIFTSPPPAQDSFSRCCISLDIGLACTNRFHFDSPEVIVFDGSPSRPLPHFDQSSVDYSRRDMTLLDDINPAPKIDLK